MASRFAPRVRRVHLVSTTAARTPIPGRPQRVRITVPGTARGYTAELDAAEKRIRQALSTSDAELAFVVMPHLLPGLIDRLTDGSVDADDLPRDVVTIAMPLTGDTSTPVTPRGLGLVTALVVIVEAVLGLLTDLASGLVGAAVVGVGLALLISRRTRRRGWTLVAGGLLGLVALALLTVTIVRSPAT